MTNPKKPLEVVFTPGAFDSLDVEDQDELDAVMKEITEMFANMTPTELEAQSRPVDWDSLTNEERAALERAINNEPRNLQ